MEELTFPEAILTLLSSVDNALNSMKNGVPDPTVINFFDLEKDRKIYLHGDVDDYIVDLQQLILRWNMEDKDKPIEERKPIILYIMSDGGYLDYMWMLIDTMNASKTPIYTVCLGKAHSAASLIFLTGHKRFMTPHAKLIVHEGSAQFGGDATKVMDATESYKKQLKEMKEYILNHSKIERTALMKKKANDWELSAEYCLANGACDKIIETLDEIM